MLSVTSESSLKIILGAFKECNMLCFQKKCPNIRTLVVVHVLFITLVCFLYVDWESNLLISRNFKIFLAKRNNSAINGRIKQTSEICARLCNSIQHNAVEEASAQVVSGGWDKCACDWNTSLVNNLTEPKCPLLRPRLSDKPLPITGLISFPGAGNTWTRHLLQQVSGWFK